jgi:hypothetical protein
LLQESQGSDRRVGALFCMPSMLYTSENESFSPSLIRAKGSEAQGHRRKAAV